MLRLRLIHFVALAALPATATPALARPPAGAVYVMTNAAAANEVVAWTRDPQGRLRLAGSFATGGRGSGGGVDPLASQDSLRLSADGRWLFAVNAGSDEVSVFRVGAQSLELVERAPSGGRFPVSLAERDGHLYVLNVGGDGTLAGFDVDGDGRLAAIPGAVRALALGGTHPPNVGRAPSQIGFTPDGTALLVVDKGGDRLLTFALDDAGRPEAPVETASAGRLPFAFRFAADGTLLVAEIFGSTGGSDPGGASAISSYAREPDGTWRAITSSLGTGETALCWIDAHGRRAWGTNTGSDTLTGFRVGRDGSLSLIAGSGVLHRFGGAARVPLDLAVTADGRFLYTLNVGTGSVGMFRIRPNGRLVPLGEAPGLAALQGAQGIAAR